MNWTTAVKNGAPSNGAQRPEDRRVVGNGGTWQQATLQPPGNPSPNNGFQPPRMQQTVGQTQYGGQAGDYARGNPRVEYGYTAQRDLGKAHPNVATDDSDDPMRFSSADYDIVKARMRVKNAKISDRASKRARKAVRKDEKLRAKQILDRAGLSGHVIVFDTKPGGTIDDSINDMYEAEQRKRRNRELSRKQRTIEHQQRKARRIEDRTARRNVLTNPPGGQAPIMRPFLLYNVASMDRVVCGEWTVRDFIEELQPNMDAVMEGRSALKPFSTRAQISKFCRESQPYYKKPVPEVVDYFCRRYGIR